MPSLVIHAHDVVGKVQPGDYVLLHAPGVRLSATPGAVTIGSTVRVELTPQPVTVPDVQPGPLVVEVFAHGSAKVDRLDVVVPASGASHSLAALLADSGDYSPEVLGEFRRLRDAVDRAAAQAKASADQARVSASAASSAGGATASTRGLVRLAGHLGGSADFPQVVGFVPVSDVAVGAEGGKLVRREAGGGVTLPSQSPRLGTDAASKSYVDGQVASRAASSHTHTLAQITNAPNEHAISAVAGSLVSRDGHGRAQFGSPVAAQDAANKQYVDAQLAGVVKSADLSDRTGGSGYVNKPVKTGADGFLASGGNPSKPEHLTNKAYVDGQVASRAASSHTHTLTQITNAPNSHSSSAVAGSLVSRDSSGRAQFATPVSAQDAATKGYVDTKASESSSSVLLHSSSNLEVRRLGNLVQVQVSGARKGRQSYVLPVGARPARNVDVMLTFVEQRSQNAWLTVTTTGEINVSNASTFDGSHYGHVLFMV